MTSSPNAPAYTSAEARARETFLALLWALSYPGREYFLPLGSPPMALISETLLDLETSFYTPDSVLHETLPLSGARPLLPETAAYHFYPTLTTDHLAPLRDASVGTLLYPDRAATIILPASFERGERFTLTGPGIDGEIALRIGDILPAFWDLRDQRRRFPLGWDVYLVDGSRVIGIPRSTTMKQIAS